MSGLSVDYKICRFYAVNLPNILVLVNLTFQLASRSKKGHFEMGDQMLSMKASSLFKDFGQSKDYNGHPQ